MSGDGMFELRLLLSDRREDLDLEPCTPWPRTIEGMAKFVASPEIADWLIARSLHTPYTHLEGYMERYWLLNPYLTYEEKRTLKLLGQPEPEYKHPSARIHHILRKDLDRHNHSHPRRARTIILKGWYKEMRLMPDGSEQQILRAAGDTATLDFDEYHRIIEVSEGGVWTLFITWQYQGTWGFLVDGQKIPYRQYLGLD